MGSKYFYFNKSLPIEEIYKQTLTFWQKNKGNIEEESLSSDKLIKTLKIHRGTTLTSNGEDYLIEFSYNPRDSSTYIRIEASLVLGYGIQWLTPKKMINKWVSELRITPTYLVGRTNKDFFDFDKIPRRRPLQVERYKPNIPPKVEYQPKITPEPQSSISNKPETSSILQYKNDRPKMVQNSNFDRFDEFAVRFCTLCGHKNKKNSNYCKNCGRKLD